jgi:hypothetical protein
MERYQMLEPAERQKQKYNGQNHPDCVFKKMIILKFQKTRDNLNFKYFITLRNLFVMKQERH